MNTVNDDSKNDKSNKTDNRSVIFNTLHAIIIEKGYVSLPGDLAHLPISERTRQRIVASLVAGGYFRRVADRLYACHRRGAPLVAPTVDNEDYDALLLNDELVEILARHTPEQRAEGEAIFKELCEKYPERVTARNTFRATTDEMFSMLFKRAPVQLFPENLDDFQ